MLDRIVNEVASAHMSQDSSHPKPEPASYMRPAALIRRKTMSKDPGVAYRQMLVRAVAAIFAPIMIRAPVPSKEKDRAGLEERKMRMIELFLSKD